MHLQVVGGDGVGAPIDRETVCETLVGGSNFYVVDNRVVVNLGGGAAGSGVFANRHFASSERRFA